VNPQNAILVGVAGKLVWVRVEGKGSFQNSPGLKEFSKEMIARGQKEFVIDLSNCPLMDSTFMGTLASIALRLRENGEGSLRVVNINERNHDLLRNLGLDQLFTVTPAGEKVPIPEQGPAQQAIETAAPDKTSQAETMLEAHEALVEAAPENYLRFKDVLEYLQQDLEQK
jgi:anti-sigma B factor antagonist